MNNPELEDFRRQWQEEVSSKSKGGRTRPDVSAKSNISQIKTPIGAVPLEVDLARTQHVHDGKGVVYALRENEQDTHHESDDADDSRMSEARENDVQDGSITSQEPQSALEHYEKAEERESQGKLGDSVNLYRKAFRLDAGVERAYRNKHHPLDKTSTTATDLSPIDAPVAVPKSAQQPQEGSPFALPPIPHLINSFAHDTICPAVSSTASSAPAPCPVASLPSELLIHILYDLAILDVGSFSRLSLVCKKLAFLVATESRIWQRVSDGSEFGFAAMHYKWARSISSSSIPTSIEEYDKGFGFDQTDEILGAQNIEANVVDMSALSLSSSPRTADLPTLSATYPTYRQLFRSYPRIRFNGCYISTVNYQRPGATSSSQVSWNTPIHIVTYYRYLRFYRDGTCISLLTTHEPVEVIHHLSKENLPGNSAHETSKRHHQHHNNNQPHSETPSAIAAGATGPPTARAVMSSALPGRWHLSPSPSPQQPNPPTATLHIETLGHDPQKYTYVMALSLTSPSTNAKSSSSVGLKAKNTKLAWKGFWSYNKLTDDWAEFGLKNDKAFWWSRVKGYGLGMEAGV